MSPATERALRTAVGVTARGSDPWERMAPLINRAAPLCGGSWRKSGAASMTITAALVLHLFAPGAGTPTAALRGRRE